MHPVVKPTTALFDSGDLLLALELFYDEDLEDEQIEQDFAAFLQSLILRQSRL